MTHWMEQSALKRAAHGLPLLIIFSFFYFIKKKYIEYIYKQSAPIYISGEYKVRNSQASCSIIFRREVIKWMNV